MWYGHESTAGGGSLLPGPEYAQLMMTVGVVPAAMELTDDRVSPDECLLTASDGSPLHSQAKVTDGAMPAATNYERLLTVSDGSPLHNQAHA